jgi:hypothetical protein
MRQPAVFDAVSGDGSSGGAEYDAAADGQA